LCTTTVSRANELASKRERVSWLVNRLSLEGTSVDENAEDKAVGPAKGHDHRNRTIRRTQGKTFIEDKRTGNKSTLKLRATPSSSNVRFLEDFTVHLTDSRAFGLASRFIEVLNDLHRGLFSRKIPILETTVLHSVME
jgi:hypothetical protein